MTPEEIARANQFREGFALVDYAEVGLPVFRLTIEGITTVQRVLPTIHEFVMRCLALGETREDEIARMLGLREDLVRAAINALVADGYVTRQANGLDTHLFELSTLGDARLEIERMEIPQEEMLVIDYDGIRRMPIRLSSTNLFRSAELKRSGAIEIRPYPADPPSIEALSIPDVTRVVRRQSGEDFRRTILALKRIVRRNNIYREAVALVFKAERGDEVQVAFAIDGKVSDQHERAFAEHGGPKKMGFLKSIIETNATRQLERLIGKETIKYFPDKNELISLRKAEADAEADIRNTFSLAQQGKKNSPAKIAFAVAQDSLASVAKYLSAYAIRPMNCYEQKSLLMDALDQAQHRLYICTSGLQPSLLNGFVLRQIDLLIESGVKVQIEVPQVPVERGRDDHRYDPGKELAKRSVGQEPILTIGPKRQLFCLIKDSDLAVISNRPFFGDPFSRSSFMFVSGAVIRDSEVVNQLTQKLLQPSRSKSGQ